MSSATPDKRERRQSQKGFFAPTRPQESWKPYAGVLLGLAAVFAVNAYFLQHMQNRLPLAGITLPIMIGAIYGGLRPALLATLLSLLAAFYIAGIRWGGPIDSYQQLQI
jgi:hypothetical protein